MEGKWKVQGARCKAQGYLYCGMWKVECRSCCCWWWKQAVHNLSQHSTSSPSSSSSHPLPIYCVDIRLSKCANSHNKSTATSVNLSE